MHAKASKEDEELVERIRQHFQQTIRREEKKVFYDLQIEGYQSQVDQLKRRVRRLEGELRLAKLREQELERRLVVRSRVGGLAATQIRWLIQLAHPDRHDGKPMAKEVTELLLRMRG